MLSKKLKNVPLKSLQLLVFLLLCTLSYGQENELVWYFKSKEKSELATIKTILDNLKKRNAASPFFKSVTYLNSLQSTDNEEFEIRKQLDRFTENGVFVKDNSNPVNNQLFNKLLGFTHFLRVELQIHPSFGEKEFTFSLYRAIPGHSINAMEAELPEIDLQSIIIKNTKITPTIQGEKIKVRIHNAIKQLIPKLNIPPISQIRINGQDTNIYHNPYGRPIELNGLFSEDADTERENFQYKWRQIPLDGNINVPIEKDFNIDKNASVAEYLLPTLDTYKIGLIVNDGIEDSFEDTLVVINFLPPKIELSKYSLRKKSKISFFQFLNPKNRSKKIDDNVKATINSNVPLQYNLNFFEVDQRKASKMEIQKSKYSETSYELNFKGKLNYTEKYQYGIYGKSGDISTDTSYYDLKHSDRVFMRLSIGTEIFVGPSILCVEPPRGKVWLVAPTSVMGSIYLFHHGGASILLESGVLIFWKESIADRLADGYGLGKIALKATTDFTNLAPYIALQLIGGITTNDTGESISRKHLGLGFGVSLFDNQLDIDLLNAYYSPNSKCFSLSGGIRYNIKKTRLF